jgi:hypothetical protein
VTDEQMLAQGDPRERGMPMRVAKRFARRQAERRASAQGLSVFRVREAKELPHMVFAAKSRSHAIALVVQSYRPWPRLSSRLRGDVP